MPIKLIKFTPLLRYLRIGWTVCWLLACVLLIVLWVRSYPQTAMVERYTNSRLFYVISFDGKVMLNYSVPELQPPIPFGWSYGEISSEDRIQIWEPDVEHVLANLGIGWTLSPNTFAAVLPDYLLVIVFAAFSGMPWLPISKRRFSLRTLLIFTTLVAVGLGVILWAVRK